MKEGDLITTYYQGYFILDRIERRSTTGGEESGPLFYFTQMFDSNGTPKKSKQKCCDSGFCRLAGESIDEELKLLDKKKEQLLKFKTLVSN